MYVYLAHEYKAHNVTMQLHLNVKRNACTRLFETVGPDAGGDCVGDPIPEHEGCSAFGRDGPQGFAAAHNLIHAGAFDVYGACDDGGQF